MNRLQEGGIIPRNTTDAKKEYKVLETITDQNNSNEAGDSLINLPKAFKTHYCMI